jgi:hypothetical protein
MEKLRASSLPARSVTIVNDSMRNLNASENKLPLPKKNLHLRHEFILPILNPKFKKKMLKRSSCRTDITTLP